MDASISAAELRKSLLSSAPPLVIDVRRNERFFEAKDFIRGAVRRDPAKVAEWSKTLPRAASVVVYCVHGHEVSQNAAKALGAKYLEGGIEAWREMGGDLFSKPKNCSSRWVTRERPKIDRIACPWLIRRFIDPGAEFLYVPAAEVKRVAEKASATPYDVAEVEFTHVGERCSFDAFLDKFHLKEQALDALATIVRGADTGRPDLAPQAAGLLAISQGLSRLYENDLEMLEHGMVMYDALYAWCRSRP
jgi:rhodanese-related sulfurtransferase